MNREYVPLTNDSLARDLADWFDRHGTRNEQLRAYYMLGRTYADRGEAPQAVIAYNDAINSADTTNTDCDYKILCRVYAQMATVLYHQDLYRDGLENVNRAVYYGYLAKDTLAALMAYTQKMDFYDMLQQPDSMLFVSSDAYEKLRQIGYSSYAAELLIAPIRYLTEIGEMSKARELMNRYERETGFFDAEGNICKGREVYYYHKGLYYLKACQYDSAEYCFRKELSTGKDFNNQNAGAYGLAILFKQTQKQDSAAKYAIYSYAMNDSAYSQKVTEDVLNTKAFYDYSRYERQAKVEQQRAMFAQLRFVFSSIVTIIVILFAVYLIRRYLRLKRLREKERQRFQQLQKSYTQTVQQIAQLRDDQQKLNSLQNEYREALTDRQHASEEIQRLQKGEQLLKDLIEKKETELNYLESELAKYRQAEQLLAIKMQEEEVLLRKTDLYKNILYKTTIGHALTKKEWLEVSCFVEYHLPDFYQFITSKEFRLTEYEFHMSMLVRLYLKPKNIANAMSLDGSYVTRVRTSMLKKLFGASGPSKDVDKLIKQIGQLRSI